MKNRLSSLLLVTLYLCCANYFLYAEDIEPGKQAEMHKIGTFLFYGVDEWNDIPLFYANFYFNIPNSKPIVIAIWKDGRIAWQDMAKRGEDFFFKSKISLKLINDTKAKVLAYNKNELPLPRRLTTSHNAPLISSMGVTSFTCSPEY